MTPPRSDRTIPWVQFFDSEGYRHGWAHDPDAEAGIVSCGEAHERQDSWLCRSCEISTSRILTDLPALLYDLSLHCTRQTSFVERGQKQEDTGESPLPYDEAASDLLADVAKLLGCAPGLARMAVVARWYASDHALWMKNPAAADWAHGLSVLYRRGHRIIERPEPLMFVGPCPSGHDIWAGRDVATVSCPCGYTATMADHQRDALDAGEDRWLTVGELVGAITKAGEAVTRDQINSWIRREGLVRETHQRPVWRNGQLLAREVYVYRLGDVRALARRADERRGHTHAK